MILDAVFKDNTCSRREKLDNITLIYVSVKEEFDKNRKMFYNDLSKFH